MRVGGKDSEVWKWYAWGLTECVGLETAWWDASETARGCQLGIFWHGLGRENHLSLQLPGWPTVPVQRTMILLDREGPVQKFPPVAGQTKDWLVGLLSPAMS